MISCVEAGQTVNFQTGAMTNRLVLRNSRGNSVELHVDVGVLQQVMSLLEQEKEAPPQEPGLSDEEIAIIRAHRAQAPPPNTEELADRLMRGEEIGDELFEDEEQPLSTPFQG